MENQEIAKTYFKLDTKIRNEKQFNRKVELNGQILKFKKEHNLTTKENDPITTIFVNGEKIATIWKQYSSRKVNLEYKELKTRKLVLE